MIQEKLYHLYYSGVDGCDLDTEWEIENENQFCRCCRRLKLPHDSLDLVTDGKVKKGLDMMMVGHLLIPGCMSFRLISLLGDDAEKHLNLGNIYQKSAEKMLQLQFMSFISKHDYIVLRGEKPDIFDGRSVAENERAVICPECDFSSRRERSPWFLFEDEYPNFPICCTGMGLLLYESVHEKIKDTRLTGVRVEKVKVKPR